MSDSVKPEIRDAMEVQRAHDTLVNIVAGQVDIGELPESERTLIHAALDVLCWTLKHDHNTKFAENLKELRQAISDAGYVEHKADAPFTFADLWRRPS